MTPIALHNNLNYIYSQSDGNKEPMEELHLEPRPALGQGSSGLFNLYSVPLDMLYSLEDQFQAETSQDREGTQENWLKILAGSFNLITSGYNALDKVSKVLIYFQAIKPNCLSFMPKISKQLPVIGLIVCGIESIIDMRGLKQAYSMLTSIHLPRNYLKKREFDKSDDQLFKSLEWLNQEFGTTSALTARASERSLIRRVYPDCAKKVREMLPQLIREYGLSDPQEWRKVAFDLLRDVNIQSQKKTLMHVTGMIASAITIAGLIAGICLCPYATVLVLIVVGGIFSTMRYGISEGMMHTHGWKFDAGNLIPSYVKKIYHMIFMRCVAPDNRYKAVLLKAL